MTTRPISDRVKVSLFDSIRNLLPDAHVLDVFAGTGTLGLEALSRGAQSVVCIEQDPRAHALLQQNVATLQAEDEVLCWRTDAVRSSFRPQGIPDWQPYDIIFFDPPYRMVKHLQPGSPLSKALERLADAAVSAPHALLLLRCETGTDFLMPPAWQLDDTLTIGRMSIHFYEKPAPPGDSASASPAAEE